MNNSTPNQLNKHCCSNCGRYWNCPSSGNCDMPLVILCAKCSNQAIKHSITEFGEGKQV